MEISASEFVEAKGVYHRLVSTLPPALQEHCPGFDHYLSPSNYSLLRGPFGIEWIALSVTGAERYGWLMSPHARALLAVYAARRMP